MKKDNIMHMLTSVITDTPFLFLAKCCM